MFFFHCFWVWLCINARTAHGWHWADVYFTLYIISFICFSFLSYFPFSTHILYHCRISLLLPDSFFPSTFFFNTSIIFFICFSVRYIQKYTFSQFDSTDFNVSLSYKMRAYSIFRYKVTTTTKAKRIDEGFSPFFQHPRCGIVDTCIILQFSRHQRKTVR